MRLSSGTRNVTAGIAMLALVAACGQPSASAPPSAAGTSAPTATVSAPPLEGGTVTVRLRGPVSSLEFTTSQLRETGGVVVSALYDRLVAIDPETREPIPYLAESWEQTPTSITFKLREGPTCADGTAVTPGVVKSSLDAFIANSPAVATSFGAGPFAVTADNAAGTVTITSDTPNVEMIYGFGDFNSSIMCPAGLIDTTKQARASFGSGPYVIEAIAEDDAFTVKLREDWTWGPNGRTAQTSGVPDTIVFKTIDNDTTAANLLLTGGLDIAQVAGADITRLEADPSITHRQVVNAVASPMLFINLPGRPTADEAVREAIMTAIDPELYNQAAFQGRGKVTDGGFVLEGNRCHDASLAELVPDHDVGAARQILLDAGYVAGGDGKLSKDGKPLAINVIGQQIANAGPEYISETLSDVGFTTTLRVFDNTEYSVTVRALDFDTLQFGVGSETVQFGRVMPFLAGGKLVTEGGVNRGTIFNDEVDAAYAAYLASESDEEACENISAFTRPMLEQHLIFPTIANSQEFYAKKFTPFTEAWLITRTEP